MTTTLALIALLAAHAALTTGYLLRQRREWNRKMRYFNRVVGESTRQATREVEALYRVVNAHTARLSHRPDRPRGSR